MESSQITKEWLETQHWKEKKSINAIAKEIGLGPTTLYYHFKKMGVKTRTVKEARRLRCGKEEFDSSRVSEGDWKSLAWAVDAEGSIYANTGKTPMLGLCIGTTSEAYVSNISKHFPGLFYSVVTSTKRFYNDEYTIHSIKSNTHDDLNFALRKIIPFLVIKRAQAIAGLLYTDKRLAAKKSGSRYSPVTTYEKELLGIIKLLNAKKQTDNDRDEVWKNAKQRIPELRIMEKTFEA